MKTISMLGGGERTRIFTLGHDTACVSICGCVTSWELPCSLLKQTLVLSFLFFFYLHAFRSITDPVHPPALPLERLCYNLWGLSFPFHTIWVDGQGQYLLSETNSSEKTSPKPIHSRFEWHTSELDLGDPLLK